MKYIVEVDFITESYLTMNERVKLVQDVMEVLQQSNEGMLKRCAVKDANIREAQ